MLGRPYSTTRAAMNRATDGAVRRGVAMGLAGSFRAAAPDRRLRDRTVAALASPNAHRDQMTRDRLVRLTQDLGRNNCVAAALVERKGEVVAGANPGLRLRAPDQDWVGTATDYLERWFVDGFDHEGVLTLPQFAQFVVENAMTAGDGLLILLGDGSCQWIDGVRIVNPHRGQDTETLIGGVRLDATGRVLGYEVASWNAQGTMLSSETEFVDAADCLYIGNPRSRQPGQRRAEPTLATVTDRLEDLDRLHLAVIKSAEMAAMLSLFIRSASPEKSVLDQIANANSPDGAKIQQAQEKGDVAFFPGSISELFPGEDIVPVSPSQPGPQYDRMVWTDLKMICARVGLPAELVFFYYTSNYAASRSAIVSAWKGVAKEQAWLRDRVLNPLIRWRLAMAIRAGELPFTDGWDRIGWNLPGVPTLDLGYEVDACNRGIAGGVMTREEAVARVNEGMTIDDFYLARGSEIVRDAEHGIVTAQPSTVSVTINRDQREDSGDQP